MFNRDLGRKERESLLKIAEVTKEGFLLKQQLIQEAMRGVDDRKVGWETAAMCLWRSEE